MRREPTPGGPTRRRRVRVTSVAGGDDPDDAIRREMRAFVRAHHPDVGGDPEQFAAGLAELRESLSDQEADGAAAAEATPGIVVSGAAKHPVGPLARVHEWRRRRGRAPRVR